MDVFVKAEDWKQAIVFMKQITEYAFILVWDIFVYRVSLFPKAWKRIYRIEEDHNVLKIRYTSHI